jgi:hypothetical protein
MRLLLIAALTMLMTPASAKRNRLPSPVSASCTSMVKSGIAANSSNVYLRSAFDTDPSTYLGRFVPTDTQNIDESMARQTRCSEFITWRRIDGGGVTYDHIFNAGTQAAANVGVPLVGGGGASASASTMIRVQYTLTDKMVAEISDPAGFEDCCRENSDSCTELFIGEFIGGTGQISCGLGQAADFNLDILSSGVVTDISAAHGSLWRSSTTFTNPVYFAFRTTEGGGVDAGCGDWTTAAPTSSAGEYFVGVSGNSTPVYDEQDARNAALENARGQVYTWALQETRDASSSRTLAADGTVTAEEMSANSSFSGVIGQLKDRNWCVQEEPTPNGPMYKAYVLTFLNQEQVEMVKEAMKP